MKHPTISRILLILVTCAFTACVEPPAGSGQSPDEDMRQGQDMSSEEMGDEADMDTPKKGEIQLIITPNLTAIEVGRSIEVEAVYVVDGALQPGVTFEWFLNEATQTSEVLRLEGETDTTVTVIGSTSGAGTVLVRTRDQEKAQTFTVTEPILAGPPTNPFEPLELMLQGEELDLDEILVAQSASGWARPLRQWCDGQPEWVAKGAVSLSNNRNLSADRVGLGELSLDCTLPGLATPFSLEVLFRVEPRYPVAAAHDYACALQPPKDGSIGASMYCWGDNTSRQVQADDRVEHTTPQELSFGAPLEYISLAPSHGCAVDTNSEIHCWGSNAGGQVDPFSLDEPGPFEPQEVALGANRKAVKVCTGERSSCALTSRGEIFCWGTNAFALFGPDDAGVEAGARSGVREVSLGNEAPTFFHDLACGPTHRCALGEDGSAHCWGENSFDVLGRPPVGGEDAGAYNRVLDANGNSLIFEQIFAGVSGTCGVTPRGHLHCWGKDYLSAGRAPFNTPLSPNNRPFWLGEARASSLEDAERIASVAMGGEHVCAVSDAGKLFCWGSSEYGELGSFEESTATLLGEYIPTPESSAPLEFASDLVSSIATGLDFTCSSDRAGTLHCWGDGSRGQLGDGQLGVTSKTFTGVSPNSPFFDPAISLELFALSRVAAGLDYTCVNAFGPNGTVHCWGNPRWGQKGPAQPLFTDIGSPNVGRKQLLATSAENRPNTVLGGGDRHVCSNTDPGIASAVLCWGANTRAQAGLALSEIISEFTAIGDDNTGVLNPPVDLIVGGRAHTCVHNYGEQRAYCWGDAERGALGVEAYEMANTSAVSFAVEVDGLDLKEPGGLTARDDYTCAWGINGKEDEIWCWGAVPNNLDGARWFAGQSIDWAPKKLDDPRKDKPVYSVAAGSRHLCALVDIGMDKVALACYGDNSRGQKGTPGEGNEGGFNAMWNADERPISLVAGREHTCALVESRLSSDANRLVYCWGDNRFGQSGGVEPNVAGRAAIIDTPTLVPGLEHLNVLQVHAGAHHTCALGAKPVMGSGNMSDFELVCWGRDSYGQVSARDVYVKPEPTVLEVLR